MVAETISLGILSLPAAVAKLGLVPAIIILIGLGILASYTGYVIGQYKIRHPHISSIADAGEVLMGRFGRELFTVANILFLVFIMASHLLTFTVALNTITRHATCSLVFGIVGMIISLILSLPRTLKKVSWLSMICECAEPFQRSNANDVSSFWEHPQCCPHHDDRCRYSAQGDGGRSNHKAKSRHRVYIRGQHRILIL